MSNFDQFPLDLETLLTVLRMDRVTGKVVARIARRGGGFKQYEGQVVLDIVAGQLYNCTLIDPRGELIAQGMHMVQEVQKLGELDWDLLLPARTVPLPQPPQPLEMSPSLSPSIADCMPRKTIDVSLTQTNGWNRRKKQVFLLIDGYKRSADIARQLRMQVSDVDQILKELYQERLIALDPPA